MIAFFRPQAVEEGRPGGHQLPEAGGHRERWTSASNRRSSGGRIRDRKRSGRDGAFQDSEEGQAQGRGQAML